MDKETDALYLRLDDSKIVESEEVSPGVIVDYNRKNAVVGVEVLYISKRAPKSGARKHSAADEAAALVLHDKPAKKYDA
jgi:uncharacterized protein YuzE